MSAKPVLPVDVAVVGAGSIGIAVAYYLVEHHGIGNVVIIDSRDPLSLTSAQSGENYRNWWPHPVMTAFTDHSIDLLEEIARATGNRIAMSRRGYALVTRQAHPEALIRDLYRGYGGAAEGRIRIHEGAASGSYQPPVSAAWDKAPDGVDVLRNRELIRKTFPTYAHDASTVLHIRRAGAISGQQLGQIMLERVRAAGGRLLRGAVAAINGLAPFHVTVRTEEGEIAIRAARLVNAAGPFVTDVAALLGEALSVSCVYQQKIAFEDRARAIRRDMPFTIDLDGQGLEWSAEERTILAEDPSTAPLLAFMPGNIHCKPEGGEDGKWIKLGWAFNNRATDPHDPDPVDAQFPDLVLRGASRLHPALKSYLGWLPRGTHHYGGYYTMTEENWPLIGPMRTTGAFIAGAMSGYGTMAACAAGSLCAAWVAERDLPDYARALSPARHADKQLMDELAALKSRGVL